MRTKNLLVSLLMMLLAVGITAQNETNPKLVIDHPISYGTILVVDVWKVIRTSNFTTDDLDSMKKAIIVFEKSNKEQSEMIKKQQDEIAKLQRANKEVESEIQSLRKTVEKLQKRIDAI